MRKSADGPLCRATVTVAVALIDIISRWDNMPFPQLSIPGNAAIPIGVRRLRSLREPSFHTPINLEAVLRCLSAAESQKDGMGQASLRRRPCLRQQISALLDPRVLAVTSRLFCSVFANFTTRKEELNTMQNRICRRSSTKCTTIATDFSLSGALFCVSDRRHALGQKRLSCSDKGTHAAGPNLK